ncbi:hypothetical protein JKA74_10930 [Marivirga sp. S37H4]|uniref:Long-chain fatty acid transport protein n=1 Tax=Marivirga aurantiaca TaxID=2802615 RepID=A0A934WZ70_9BACT|nr:hypothetical protein [Marivirga aurantiaca]MBK6265552.1 hypothetical protein [Marivirga aurantiaca]
MHQFKTGFLAFILSITFVSQLFSQGTVSPYSAYGIGLQPEKSYASNNGMGNAGLAYSSPWFIPVLNPALLGNQTFTSFEAGLGITQTAVRDEINRYNQVNGGLRYISLALPIVAGKYGISISLNPYSDKNYNLVQAQDDTQNLRAGTKRYEGSGTISQLTLANGWNITKNISIGAEANYNFGKITDRTIYQNIIHGEDSIRIPYVVSGETVHNYSDFSFLLGTRLQHKIGKNNLGLGITYDLPANLNTTRNTFLQFLSTTGTPLDPQTGLTDSTNFSTFNQEGNTAIPGKLSVGLSFWRQNKWAVSTDFTYQDWEQYELFGEKDLNLSRKTEVKIGAEYTPDVQAGDNYFKRMTYRAGLHVDNGPIVINNTSINSFGITFGTTLPISKVSNVNLAFEVGQRGTLINNLVREDYFSFNLSFTYNDRWFLRRQFD